MDYAQHLGGLNIKRSIDTLSTAHVAGDYALSGGFGSTAVVTLASANDSGGKVTITCGGTGHGANPTCTLTFKDGAFPVAPVIVTSRAGTDQPTVNFSVTTTTTAAVFTFNGTASGSEVYTFTWKL